MTPAPTGPTNPLAGRKPPLAAPTVLRTVAVAAAISSVTMAIPANFSTAVGLVVSVALFFLAERFDPPPSRAATALRPIAWPRVTVASIVAGLVLCALAAAAVAAKRSLTVQHLPWALALVSFAVAAAAATGPRTTHTSRNDRAAFLLVAVTCIAAFGWHLTSIPFEVHGDEAEVALDALRLLQEPDRGIFSTSWFGLPILHAAPTALGLLLFGNDLFGLRMTSAILASGTVLLLFAATRRLAGTPMALVAAMTLAGQRYFIHLGRAGYHYIDTPFLSVLAIWLMLRLWQDRSLSSAIWCGVFLGLGVQTYYASRIVPLLLAATTLVVAVRAGRGSRLRYLGELAVVAAIAIAVAAPLFAHFSDHMAELWARTQETSVFNPESRQHLAFGYGTDSLREILQIQFAKAFSVFHFTGDTSVQYGYQAPMLDIVGGILFLAGLGTALARPSQPLYAIVLLWTFVPLVIGGALTIDTPFYPRLSGIVPFACLTVALGLRKTSESIAGLFAARQRRVTIAIASSILLIVVLGLNATSYFKHYANTHRSSGLREIAEWIRDQGPGAETFMFDQNRLVSVFHGTISFLAAGSKRKDVVDVPAFFAGPPVDRPHSRFVLMRGSEGILPHLQESYGPLEVETHRDRHGQIQFQTARPRGEPHRSGTRSGKTQPGAVEVRPPEIDGSRATAWLALLGLMSALGASAAWRQRFTTSPAAAAPADADAAAIGPATAAEISCRSPQPTGRPAVSAASLAGTPLAGTPVAGTPVAGTPVAPTATATAPLATAPLAIAPLATALLAIALLAILLLASWLRLTRLSDIPAGFYCDEAGNLYNSASILRTGRDETGARLPLYIWSFDTSYKNPVFIYAEMIPVALFGATPFAARLTAAAFGIGAVIGIFFLGQAMVGTSVGLFAALLLAVLPWHLHFSRIAFELIAFPTVFIAAAVALLLFVNGWRTLPWAAALLSLSLYTYVPAKLFVPLFVASFCLLFFRDLWRRKRETAIAAVVLLLTAAPVAFFDLSNDNRASRYFRDTTFLSPDLGITQIATQLAQNYSHFFSPIFLFEKGDRVLRHAVLDHGELYPIMAPLLLLGLIAIVRARSRKATLVLVWLALYPLAAALMRREIPSASRAIIGAPALCLLAAIGADWIWRGCRSLATPRLRASVIQGVALSAFIIVLLAQTARYWTIYSEDYASYAAKYFIGFQYGHEQVVDYFRAHYDDYDRLILTTTWSNQPEIFLRLFAGLDQPPSEPPPLFKPPPKIEKGTPEELHLYNAKRILFAVVPRDLMYFADYDVVGKIPAPDGSAAFLLVEVHEPKDFVYVWIIAGPYPSSETPPLPPYDPASPPRLALGGREWQRYQMRKAAVYLDNLYGEETDDACAWAVNFAYSDTDQSVHVFAGFDDDGEVWVNGTRIPMIDEDNPFQTWIDTRIGKADLKQGRNSIAVKTCDLGGAWTFYFRLAGDDGKRVPGLDWEYGFEEAL